MVEGLRRIVPKSLLQTGYTSLLFLNLEATSRRHSRAKRCQKYAVPKICRLFGNLVHAKLIPAPGPARCKLTPPAISTCQACCRPEHEQTSRNRLQDGQRLGSRGGFGFSERAAKAVCGGSHARSSISGSASTRTLNRKLSNLKQLHDTV